MTIKLNGSKIFYPEPCKIMNLTETVSKNSNGYSNKRKKKFKKPLTENSSNRKSNDMNTLKPEFNYIRMPSTVENLNIKINNNNNPPNMNNVSVKFFETFMCCVGFKRILTTNNFDNDVLPHVSSYPRNRQFINKTNVTPKYNISNKAFKYSTNWNCQNSNFMQAKIIGLTNNGKNFISGTYKLKRDYANVQTNKDGLQQNDNSGNTNSLITSTKLPDESSMDLENLNINDDHDDDIHAKVNVVDKTYNLLAKVSKSSAEKSSNIFKSPVSVIITDPNLQLDEDIEMESKKNDLIYSVPAQSLPRQIPKANNEGCTDSYFSNYYENKDVLPFDSTKNPISSSSISDNNGFHKISTYPHSYHHQHHQKSQNSYQNNHGGHYNSHNNHQHHHNHPEKAILSPIGLINNGIITKDLDHNYTINSTNSPITGYHHHYSGQFDIQKNSNYIDIQRGGHHAFVTGQPISPSGSDINAKLLPDPSYMDVHKLCVVIDLDETLVHSSFKPVDNADYVIPVNIDDTLHEVYVLKRPHVDEFLQNIYELFECVLFTASLSKYADPVANLLDTDGKYFKTRLFREACVFYQGNYVKDLNRLGRNTEKVIIIDNSPASYIFNPENAIPISSWFGDREDTELLKIIPVLQELSRSNNVMQALNEINAHQQTINCF